MYLVDGFAANGTEIRARVPSRAMAETMAKQINDHGGYVAVYNVPDLPEAPPRQPLRRGDVLLEYANWAHHRGES